MKKKRRCSPRETELLIITLSSEVEVTPPPKLYILVTLVTPLTLLPLLTISCLVDMVIWVSFCRAGKMAV